MGVKSFTFWAFRNRCLKIMNTETAKKKHHKLNELPEQADGALLFIKPFAVFCFPGRVSGDAGRAGLGRPCTVARSYPWRYSDCKAFNVTWFFPMLALRTQRNRFHKHTHTPIQLLYKGCEGRTGMVAVLVSPSRRMMCAVGNARAPTFAFSLSFVHKHTCTFLSLLHSV